MPATLHRFGPDDFELARRVGEGDAAAFAMLDARHRQPLERYAGGLLRRSEHDAQDVVQDVLIRAHQALLSGHAPEELRPWLYRLTRNRAIDEVRRARWGDESLDSDHAFRDERGEDPETVLGRRDSMRRLVEDLADLPVRQRTALLARELDGQSAEQVAAQLGVSVMAAHKLASRARASLIRTRAARDADCPEVQAALLDAHERGVRPTEHALRHVKTCDACRAHRRDVRRLSKRLLALNPAVGLPLLAGIASAGGGGGAKVAAGVVAAIAIATTGAVAVLDSGVHSPGDPAPFRLLSTRDSQGRPITRGTPIPEGHTIVTAKVRVEGRPAASPRGTYATVTIPCPKGMKYYSLDFVNRELPGNINPVGDQTPGQSSSITYALRHAPTRPAVFTLAIACRRPDQYGSMFADTRVFRRALKRGERRLGRICSRYSHLSMFDAPGGTRSSAVFRGAPVAIQRRSRSGTWTRIVSDFGDKGWIRTSDLCP